MAKHTPRLGGHLPRSQARAARSITESALAARAALSGLDDDELAERAERLASRVATTGGTVADLAECAALCSEAARRTLGLEMHANQVLAGVTIALGCVVELATGEGKTLVATIPATWFALDALGCHVATANDYLAERDAAWMSPVYDALGLRAAYVGPAMTTAERQDAYAADITYATASELGFDYLRDHLVQRAEDIVGRGHHALVVDEADALLIDEARTPLIISGTTGTDGLGPDWARYAELVARLDERHYDVERDRGNVALTEEGLDVVQEALGTVLDSDQLSSHHVLAALTAEVIYERDRHYIVTPPDGDEPSRVLLVDEHTGRPMPDHRLRDSLHEAIEAKEGVPIRGGRVTTATMSLQSLFGSYTHLGGMSGTAESDHEELEKTYGLGVAVVPTHLPVIRRDDVDVLYRTNAEKLDAVATEVARRSAAGQPVLVGAPTVADAETVSAALDDAGVAHSVLSARHPATEAAVVAQAGRPGAVTVATNMAGRGVDIRLGGNPAALAAAEVGLDVVDGDAASALASASPELVAAYEEALARLEPLCAADRDAVLAAGGLFVCGTSRHSSRRIDDQLRGRAGRQGEPGLTRFYLSLEDRIVTDFAGDAAGPLLGRIRLEPGQPLESKMFARVVATAQERQEANHRAQRDQIRRYDGVDVLLRERMYELRDSVLVSDFDQLVDDWAGHAAELAISEVLPDGRWDRHDYDELRFAIGPITPNGVPREAMESSSLDEAVSWVVKAVHKDLTNRWADAPENVRDELVKRILLDVADSAWAGFLQECEVLSTGIHLRAQGGRNPQTEYAAECDRLFRWLIDEIYSQGVTKLMQVYLSEYSAEPAA